MKLLVAIGVFIWLLCGLVGAWMLDEGHNYQAIARGPLTLAKAFDEKPVTYPGPS